MTRFYQMALGFGLLGLAPVFAQFTAIPQPTGSYTSGSALMAISTPDLTSVGTTLTDGTQTLTFSTAPQARTVPTNWATWANTPNTEGNTPKIVAIITGLTSFTITLSVPTTTFGFEFEPNAGTHTISATFLNGSTTLGTISQSVAGASGARLFAATSTTPITSVSLSIPAGASGFGLARFRYTASGPTVTPIPAAGPASLGALSLLLAAAGTLLARKRA